MAQAVDGSGRVGPEQRGIKGLGQAKARATGSCRAGRALATAILVALGILSAPQADAADTRCVRKAIAKAQSSVTKTVRFTLVTLHPNGIAGYASGEMVRCPNARCLKTTGWFKLLLSDRKSGSQPFNVQRPLLIALDALYESPKILSRLHSATDAYSFSSTCVKDLVTGNDQWGNHWTISFQ